MVSRFTRAVLSTDMLRRYVLRREWAYQTLEHPRTWKALLYHSLLYVVDGAHDTLTMALASYLPQPVVCPDCRPLPIGRWGAYAPSHAAGHSSFSTRAFLCSLTLLIANLILIVVDQDPGLSVSPVPLESLELILGLNIIIEYPLRVWSAGSQDMYRQWLRLRFMLEPLMLIELLVKLL
jgi:hypothetical protein